jgi:hypothetical protein
MSLIWSGRILVLLLPLLLFILILPASSLSYMALLESLDKSPEMNNRCLICVVALSPRSKDLMLLLIVMVFQPPFVLFGIFLGYFSIKILA